MLGFGSTNLLDGLRGTSEGFARRLRRLESIFVPATKRIRSRVWLGFLVGAFAAGLGLLLRLALVGPAIAKVPYVTFFPVITLAAVCGGLPSGTVAILASAIALHSHFVPLSELGDWINFMFFLVSNLLTIGIVEMLYRAQIRAARAEADKEAVAWSAKREELLSRIATRLLQSRDPQSVLPEICREVMNFLDCQVFLNYLVDDRSGRLYLNAHAGVSEEFLPSLRVLDDLGRAACGCAAGDIKRVLCEDIGASSEPGTEALRSIGIQSYACLPLLDQRRMIGALTFGDCRRSRIKPSAIEVMEAASHLVSLALSRIRIERALRESEERFSRFMNNFIGCAWIKDDRGRYVYANESFTRITSWPLDQIRGRTDEEVFGAETARQVRENDRLALESPFGLTTIEHLLDKNGTRRHFLVSKFPAPGGLEQKAYVAGIAIDDTQRVQAEARLKDATGKLREADRRKDEFLAMLAHELRNPLAPIRAGLQVLRATNGQGPAAERVQSMMERQVEHLVRLVDDLLEASRISCGMIELRKEPLDLASVIESAVETCRQSIDANRLELRVDLPAEPLQLNADRIRLAQVVANLLNNAAKYTEAGGRIEIRAERQGPNAVLTVADTGVGIPPDMLPRVFDLFAQAESALGRAQGGLGIGLALVRKLVELHGGGVEALSEGEGKGSRFVVHLPLIAAGGRAAPSRRPTEAHAPAPPRRVLVVDDNPDVADSLALLLQTLGADVHVAYDGVAGLDALARFHPDVVFLDIGMTGMDGFETARQMRALPQGRDVTLVALTGWGAEETRKQAETSGFDRHLTKPAQLDEVRQALELSNRPAHLLENESALAAQAATMTRPP